MVLLSPPHSVSPVALSWSFLTPMGQLIILISCPNSLESTSTCFFIPAALLPQRCIACMQHPIHPSPHPTPREGTPLLYLYPPQALHRTLLVHPQSSCLKSLFLSWIPVSPGTPMPRRCLLLVTQRPCRCLHLMISPFLGFGLSFSCLRTQVSPPSALDAHPPLHLSLTLALALIASGLRFWP